jgi:hypothetical protein
MAQSHMTGMHWLQLLPPSFELHFDGDLLATRSSSAQWWMTWLLAVMHVGPR